MSPLNQDIAKAATNWNSRAEVKNETISDCGLEPTTGVEGEYYTAVLSIVGWAGEVDQSSRSLELGLGNSASD
jgi:hypothetical protein